MKPRSAGHVHVEAVEKPLSAEIDCPKWRGLTRAIFHIIPGICFCAVPPGPTLALRAPRHRFAGRLPSGVDVFVASHEYSCARTSA